MTVENAALNKTGPPLGGPVLSPRRLLCAQYRFTPDYGASVQVAVPMLQEVSRTPGLAALKVTEVEARTLAAVGVVAVQAGPA